MNNTKKIKLKDIDARIEKLRTVNIYFAMFISQLIEYFDKTGTIPREVLNQMVKNAKEAAERMDFADSISIISDEDDAKSN